jgi:hypothetical protein
MGGVSTKTVCFKDVWIWENVIIYLRWLEFIAVLPRVSHLISNILKCRRKVTNRGKTDVLSKPLKCRIRIFNDSTALLFF